METNSTSALIPLRSLNETLTVSSTDLANGLDIQHKNLLDTIRTHQATIEESFGLIAFETEAVKKDSAFQTRNLSDSKRSTKPLTLAYLTEDQAMFIGTLSRNSKRVVEFKATLVKSFAQARSELTRQRLQAPGSTTEQALMQLIAQSNQLMAAQQQMMADLRANVDELRTGQGQPIARAPKGRPAPGGALPNQQLGLPGIPTRRDPPARPASVSLRQTIHQLVVDYSAYQGAPIHQTYGYLYKRMFEVHGLSVHRLNRQPTESLLDVLERYRQLDNLHSLALNELTYPHE